MWISVCILVCVCVCVCMCVQGAGEKLNNRQNHVLYREGYFQGVYILQILKLLQFAELIFEINRKPHPLTQRSDFMGAIFVEIFHFAKHTPLENNPLHGIHV